MKYEHFSLIEYARHIKMGENLKHFSKDFHFEIVQKDKPIPISNFAMQQQEFIKYIPTKISLQYLKVYKSITSYEEKLSKLKQKIIFIQLLLLVVFGLISYFLARNALKPLQESIDTLDRFAKDLIHDLNTPLTAMKLNLKLLEKDLHVKELKSFIRMKKSVETILELQKSLTVLRQNKAFQIAKINLCPIVYDVVELHKSNFPNLSFLVRCTGFEVKTNPNAIKQVLQNLISNAAKYNKPNGYIKIYTQRNRLFIQDSGIGIEEASKIFDREYSTHNSSGLGLDIVKRLCDAMEIQIEVESSQEGSLFILEFSQEL